MRDLFRVSCDEKGTEVYYAVRLLHEFGKSDGYLSPKKVAEFWDRIRGHSVLFSDHTQGQVEPFLASLFNPASVWLEVVRIRDEEPVALIYISSVIPNFDAKGHFAVWDGMASKRKPVFLEIMRWMFDRYNLRRISAEAPPYQGGVLRFIERHLGMKKEGEKREAVLYKERWWPLIQFGILRAEFEAFNN